MNESDHRNTAPWRVIDNTLVDAGNNGSITGSDAVHSDLADQRYADLADHDRLARTLALSAWRKCRSSGKRGMEFSDGRG